MSFIEGIGDDILYAFSFLLFLGIISLAWLSTRVNQIDLPSAFFVIERRNEEDESERASPVNEQPISPNETLTEHESDIELSEIDETELSRISNIDSISSSTEEDQSLRITIKFLNETQKIILANSNDTISKIKRLYFPDELASNKIIRFIYQGRELKDSETLRACNIRDQTIIHCQITTRRHSTPNRIDDRIPNSNGFDSSSFFDPSPINLSSYLILFLTLILGSVWYLRIKYRVLFTPISTIILIIITIFFLIFTCGPLLSPRRQISDAIIPHVHRD